MAPAERRRADDSCTFIGWINIEAHDSPRLASRPLADSKLSKMTQAREVKSSDEYLQEYLHSEALHTLWRNEQKFPAHENAINQ